MSNKLIKKFQNPAGSIDYTKTIRTEEDENVPKFSRSVYSQFNPAWGYPNLLGAISKGASALVRSWFNNDNLQYEVGDKAGDSYWRYRLGLSVDPEHFGEVLDDGSVTLPEYVEMEIPTDTTLLKNRIAADEEYLRTARFTPEEWQIANGLVNTDKATLESLRHTYKTGEPVSINEYSYNSRPLLKKETYTTLNSPLNMLQNFDIQYIPYDNYMRYSDVYDFNSFEPFVPGEAYTINGAVDLNKKKK